MDQEFSFGKWIEKRRKSLGLSQHSLASQVGYSVAMIRKIEDDERRPSPQAAALLAEALQIPPDQQENFLKVARQERAVDQLGSARLGEPFPWQVSSQPQTNLPLPVTLFVGREAELARLNRLLQDPACRLVTLVGLAGIGKTRLAVQAAGSLLDRFTHGVFFVPLASVGSPERIAATIAKAIGFQLHGPAEPKAQLWRHLEGKRMLLILDNFEHLIEEANLVSEMLQAASGIQLLVTSRERLNLQGEWLFEVEGLSYPSTLDVLGVERVAGYDAIQLFLQSALRVEPRFMLTAENWEWVVRICQLLEGIPLGIELAAAWVRVLSLGEITREIQNNMDFLKVSARDIPERHRSLRAALDHSWNLLPAQEKAVLRRLSVFCGGFRREAAREVAGASLEELASLLDKSLLKRVGEERYDLHEIVRQYGAANLESEAQEYTHTHDRHSSYFALLLEQWERQIRSPRQMEILAAMNAEMDNVRLAWRWMLMHQHTENIQKSLNCLWRFYTVQTQLREGASFFIQAAEALKLMETTEEAQDAERLVLLVQVLARLGYFYLALGRRQEGRELLQESLALLHTCTDQARLAETLAVLGFMKYRLGEFVEARQLAQESLNLNRALGYQYGIVFSMMTQAYVCLAQGAYEEAYLFSSESLAICRDILGDPQGMAVSLTVLSAVANRLGQFAEAKQLAVEGIQIARTINDVWGLGILIRQLGVIQLDQGETMHAKSLIQQSVSQFREIGDSMLLAISLVDLGVATRASGAYAESEEYFLEALQTAAETKTLVIVLNALTEIATTEMQEGEWEWALEMVILCQQHTSASLKERDLAESGSQRRLGRWGQHRYARLKRLRAELEAQLTPQQVAEIVERAKAHTLDSVVRGLLAQRTEV